MSESVLCNVCDNPQSFESSHDVAQIPSNVRKFQDEQFTVWRCENCKSLHSKESVDLDRYYDGYFLQSHRVDFHTRLGYGNRLRMLRRYGLTADSSLLDYGCGSGVFVSFLRRKGFRRVNGYDAFVPEFADENVLDKQYDVIVSYDVIEHVEEPRDFLKVLVGRLRKGGLLVIGTPNAAKLSLSFPMAMEFHQPYHRHILSEQSLINLGREHGLRARKVCRRYWLDTLIPTVNTRFAWEYIYRLGGLADVAMEKPQVGMVLTSPRLLFFAVAGYFFPARGNMLIFFEGQ